MGLYVAFDGNYGDSEGLVVIDNDNFDEHFYNYLDFMSDWLRPDFARWFEHNDHNFQQVENSSIAECQVCEDWIDSQR